jgi:hypothetical protein
MLKALIIHIIINNYIILSNKITSISEKYNNNNYHLENDIEKEK